MTDKFTADNISVNPSGHLTFAGQDCTEIAHVYGTPLYLMDEERIRANCRMYLQAFRDFFGENALPLYASKAASFKQMYRIMKEEGMGIDVVSAGEILTAKAAGFDLGNAYFHSNNKTDEDIAFAMENGVGCFVVDNIEEIRAIEREAAARGILQEVLLRLTPGIDPHTYAAVNTGCVDSKFGSAIETGQAEEITGFTLEQPHITLAGFHCHVGSMVFAEDVFERAAQVMLGFIADVKEKYGFVTRKLDLGGGFGVPYVMSDGRIDIPEKIRGIAETITKVCRERDLTVPFILMEPGRSIVADAGMTLYTVGTVKRIPGYKNYVSIDGGMSDNPRFALYRSKYTCFIANRMNEACPMKASLVGRLCESGDIIQENVSFPETVTRGDIAAVCTTGAYNYSMASNYNRLGRPPVVMLRNGESYIAVRRETPEDVLQYDL